MQMVTLVSKAFAPDADIRDLQPQRKELYRAEAHDRISKAVSGNGGLAAVNFESQNSFAN
jgi:hypothetical protein